MERFDSVATPVGALPPHYLAAWGLLALLSVALLVSSRTAWGRRRPMWRYTLLAAAAHAGLFCLATTISFLACGPCQPGPSRVRVRLVMRADAAAAQPVVRGEADDPAAPPPEPPAAPSSELDASVVGPAEPQPPGAQPPELPAMRPPAPAEAPARVGPPPVLASASPATENPVSDALARAADHPPPGDAPTQQARPAVPPRPRERTPPQAAYAHRQTQRRMERVRRQGGSRQTEDAVAAGLDWLASAQSPDGRWDSDRWSGGRETWTLGHDRRGAGGHADAGVTGLALLAMLGAGHSAAEGEHAGPLRNGANFLLREQRHDGDLAGGAALYARTYCHSMAAFALAETLASLQAHERRPLTESIRRGVRLAVDHLASTQDPSGGGWRYRPGDRGDLSQLGWVVMALRSAELAGVPPPPRVWAGVERFLRATRRGSAGGLASYQPHGSVSRTMTAESLYCRQIVGWPTAAQPATAEALAYLLTRTPGQGRHNLYYWYYATLAIHHGSYGDRSAAEAWRRWNQAMSSTLVDAQVTAGPLAGSWEPNTVWGGYGGRVYATAMAAMCLEVYYRYDPAHVRRDPWLAARPESRLR